MTHKPGIGIGTIYSRNGRWYFECKPQVKQTSLRTPDPFRAEQIALAKFGHLLKGSLNDPQDPFNQLFDINQPEAQPETAEVKINRIELITQNIMAVYRKQMRRINVKHFHVDATASEPLTDRRAASIISTLNQFIAWTNKHYPSLQYMDEITIQIADGYFDQLRDSHKATTYNKYLGSLIVVWKRLAIKAGISINPFLSIPRLSQTQIKSESVSWKPFTEAEIARLLTDSPLWVKATASISIQTALRFGDVLTLKNSEFDLERKTLIRTIRKTGKFQGFSLQDVSHIGAWLVSQERQREIDAYIKIHRDDKYPTDDISGYVFPHLAITYLSSNHSWCSALFHKVLKTLSIQTEENGRTVRGFHSLRVSKATSVFSENGDIQASATLLGHSQTGTTQSYIQETREAVEERLHRQAHASIDQIATLVSNLPAEDRAALLAKLTN
jgi:integrase